MPMIRGEMTQVSPDRLDVMVMVGRTRTSLLVTSDGALSIHVRRGDPPGTVSRGEEWTFAHAFDPDPILVRPALVEDW